jgi:hypothetical protein
MTASGVTVFLVPILSAKNHRIIKSIQHVLINTSASYSIIQVVMVFLCLYSTTASFLTSFDKPFI